MRREDPSVFKVGDSPADGAIGSLTEALGGAQADLEESRREFQSVLQCLAGLFYRCELKAPWRMSFISDGVEELTGYCSDEIDRKNGWTEIVFPSDLESVQNAVDEAIATHREFAVTYRILHKSGEVRWVGEQGHVIYDSCGEPLALEGVITDVSGRKQAEELQKTLIARWQKILDTIPQMVWSMTADGSDEFYNIQWQHFTGQTLGTRQDVTRIDLVHPQDRDRARALWEESLRTGRPYEAQYRIAHNSGEYRWVLSRAQPERDVRGNVTRWYGTCTDVHERVSTEQALQAHQGYVQRLISASPDSIVLLDEAGVVLYANGVATVSLCGGSSENLVGRRWTDLLPMHARADASKASAGALQSGAAAHFTANLRTSGESWWDVIVTPVCDEGDNRQLLITSRDITHQKVVEHQAKWSASHDSLTGLPNRTALHHRLDAALESSDGAAANFALLLIDIDEFKKTNDTLGHDAGDALLCAVADRLRRAVRPDDLVARLGGDEFVILLTEIVDSDALAAFRDKLFNALREPCIYGDKLLECSVSVGAAMYPLHGRIPADLLKNADLALYAAKSAGRGILKVFEPDMRADTQRRQSMLALAKQALAEDLIFAHYQPKVELVSGKVAGYEALLRWRHPRHGEQAPGTIAAAFEDLALAPEISNRMIDHVILDVRRWLDAGAEFQHVAINAGAAELRGGDFADRLLARCAAASVPPHFLQLEVTESVFLGRGAEYVERALRDLSASGVGIALDDFGTGFASLSHLKQFPVHVIKIDQSFIRNLKDDPDDRAIVDAVISLARSLQIDVVAEGIETQAQHDTLLKLGCRYGQGFLYGKPNRELLSAN